MGNIVPEAVAQPGGRQARRGGPRFFCGGPDRSKLPLEGPRFSEIRASKYMNTSDMISSVETSR